VVDALSDPAILAELARAWEDSLPHDHANRHEEGEYIVRNDDLSYGVVRFSRGGDVYIAPLPLDGNSCYEGREVVAMFHTHPNPPEEIDRLGVVNVYPQEPSDHDLELHDKWTRSGLVSRWLVISWDFV
jgi:hypothetical protein